MISVMRQALGKLHRLERIPERCLCAVVSLSVPVSEEMWTHPPQTQCTVHLPSFAVFMLYLSLVNTDWFIELFGHVTVVLGHNVY